MGASILRIWIATGTAAHTIFFILFGKDEIFLGLIGENEITIFGIFFVRWGLPRLIRVRWLTIRPASVVFTHYGTLISHRL
ncbi:hypothetical protein [Halocatena marina]|uniref:Uncharacterized protein n=1 Tax=Halocatena marina TaxID=2934937 RepID=A0ABD5YS60_9EURY|nr:hypothetical protein [Halocatena marina]